MSVWSATDSMAPTMRERTPMLVKGVGVELRQKTIESGSALAVTRTNQ